MKKKANGSKLPSRGTDDWNEKRNAITQILASYDKKDRAELLECCRMNIMDLAGDDKAAHELLDAADAETYQFDADRIADVMGII